MNPLLKTEMKGGMRVQKFSFRRNQPIYVRTPLGTIALENSTDDQRRILIRMPNWMVASQAPPFERADDVPTFVEEETGEYRAKFSVMVPTVDDNGRMTGIAVPEVLKITSPPLSKTSGASSQGKETTSEPRFQGKEKDNGHD